MSVTRNALADLPGLDLRPPPTHPGIVPFTSTRTLQDFGCGRKGFTPMLVIFRPSTMGSHPSRPPAGPTRNEQCPLFFLAPCFRRLMTEVARVSPALVSKSPLVAESGRVPSPCRDAKRAVARTAVG